MSSISPASSRARMVLYRHMCCEPAVKTNVSPLRERGYNSVSGGKHVHDLCFRPPERTQGGRRVHSLCERERRRVWKSRA